MIRRVINFLFSYHSRMMAGDQITLNLKVIRIVFSSHLRCSK